MARLEGKKPDAGAIIIGAIIFSLIAAGLFFAFRPVPEPTDAGLSNSTESIVTENSSDSNATGGESDNGLATILTPLPLATPTIAPLPLAPTGAITPMDNNVTAPVDNGVATLMPTPVATIANLNEM